MAESILLERVYQLTKDCIEDVARFDRAHRAGLGRHLEDSVCILLEQTVAQYGNATTEGLSVLSRNLDMLRLYIRLEKDTRQISIGRYEVVSKQLSEIGRLVGGWQKSQRSRSVASA